MSTSIPLGSSSNSVSTGYLTKDEFVKARRMQKMEELKKVLGEAKRDKEFLNACARQKTTSDIPLSSFKVSLIGDKNVGKSVFLRRQITGKFEQKYFATNGVEVIPLIFNTSKGKIRLNVWDCAGDPKLAGLDDGYWKNSQAVFLMFDITNSASFETAKKRFDQVTNLLGRSNPAIVVSGNKIDCVQKRGISADEISDWERGKNLDYCNVSAKSNYNFDKPWLLLLRKLTGNSSLEFVEYSE